MRDPSDIENYAITRLQWISFRTSDCGRFIDDASTRKIDKCVHWHAMLKVTLVREMMTFWFAASRGNKAKPLFTTSIVLFKMPSEYHTDLPSLGLIRDQLYVASDDSKSAWTIKIHMQFFTRRLYDIPSLDMVALNSCVRPS